MEICGFRPRRRSAAVPTPAATRAVVAAMALALVACGDDDGTGPGASVATVNVTAPSQTIVALGSTVQMQASALDANGDPVSGATFTWSSSVPAVAGVDASGLVTAVSNGETTITANAGGASGSLVIRVEQVAAALAFASPPANNWVDAPFAGLAVEARDANGNVAASFSDAVTISIGANPLGGSLTGQFTRDAASGVAAFPGLALDEAGAGYTLVATAGALSVESDPFNITRPSAYLGYGSGNHIAVIDLASNSVIDSVTVGSAPRGAALTPDGLYAYILNSLSDDVSVIETPGNTVVATIAVGDRPWHAAVSPDGTTVYVTNSSDSTVSVIETGSNAVSATIKVGVLPNDVALTPDGAFAYVTNGLAADDVRVIATGSNTVVATIPVGDSPRYPAVTPDGTAVFVPNAQGGTISRIDTASNTVSATIDVGGVPVTAAVTPDGQLVYVTDTVNGPVSVIDVANNTVVETITVDPGQQWDIAIMPAPLP